MLPCASSLYFGADLSTMIICPVDSSSTSSYLSLNKSPQPPLIGAGTLGGLDRVRRRTSTEDPANLRCEMGGQLTTHQLGACARPRGGAGLPGFGLFRSRSQPQGPPPRFGRIHNQIYESVYELIA